MKNFSLEHRRSERLLLERLRREDLPDWCQMQQDARVMASLGGLRSDEESAAMLEQALGHWECHGFGWWTLRDPESRDFVGRGGLRRVRVEGREELEIGYALLPAYWGMGLATELATTSAGVAFEMLGSRDLVSFTLPTNLASRRVMEKAGLHYERDIVYANLPHVLYRLTAAAWRAAPLRRE